MRVARGALWRQLQQPSCAQRARPAWWAALGHLAGADLATGRSRRCGWPCSAHSSTRLTRSLGGPRTPLPVPWVASSCFQVPRAALGAVRTHSDAVSLLHAVCHGLLGPWSRILALCTAILVASVRAVGTLPTPERAEMWSSGHPGLAAGS